MITTLFSSFGTLDAARELRAIVIASDGSRQDYLSKWPTLRRALLEHTVPARLRILEQQLNAKNRGFVAEVEARVDSIREAPRVLDLTDWPEAKRALIREYLYLKHSNDVLGRGVGITATALDRQFGLRALQGECSLTIDVACTRCAATVPGQVTSLTKDLSKERWLGLEVRCGSCGHLGLAGNLSSLQDEICRCPSCLQDYRNSAQAIQQKLNGILERSALDLQRMCLEEIEQTVASPEVLDGSLEGSMFAARMHEHPATDLYDALKDLVLRGQEIAHPFIFQNRLHQLACRLRGEGLLKVTAECPALDDPEELLYLALTTPSFFRSEDEFEKKRELAEQHYTLVRRGARDVESFLAWRAAVDELGMVPDRYMPLPIKFTWALPERPAAARPRTEPGELYSYGWVEWSSKHCFYNEPSPLTAVVDLQKSIFSSHIPELMQQMRELGAPGMVTALRKELSRDWPVADETVENIKAAILGRSKRRLGESFMDSDALPVLSSLLYFQMSREAIGEAEGVALKDISEQFGRASTPFRKHILAAHMPFPCPCCENEGLVFDMVLDSKGLSAGSFSCSHCGHQAQKGGLNALSCQCSICKSARDAALVVVQQSADSIVHALVADLDAATAKLLEKVKGGLPRQQHWRLMPDNWEAYAALRHDGRTPLEALGTIVGGSEYARSDSRGYIDEHDGMAPHVLSAGVFENIFVVGAPEIPSSEVRIKFLQARLLECLNARLANSKFEVTLHFDDVASLILALKNGAPLEIAAIADSLVGGEYNFSRTSSLIVPIRWKLSENEEKMRELAVAAERKRCIPEHIYFRQPDFDRAKYGKPLHQMTFPEWPVEGAPEPVTESRTSQTPVHTNAESAVVDAAVRLLLSLGYQVVPPGIAN